MFDDLVRMLMAPPGTVAGMTREAQAAAGAGKEWVGGMDFVSRDEFEAVKAMVIAARDDNDALRARIAILEAARSGRRAGARSFDKPGDSYRPINYPQLSAGQPRAACEFACASRFIRTRAG
jgi:BMFP domain-containing protein YqiC